MFKRKEEKYLQVEIFYDREWEQMKPKINEFLETIGDNIYTIKTTKQEETSSMYARGLVHIYYWVNK